MDIMFTLRISMKILYINEFGHADLDLDLGIHNDSKIDGSDAVVLSPSLWNEDIAKRIIAEGKLLSDVLTMT